MNISDLVRQKLREIITMHARPPDLDARRCEGLLRDLCGERDRREINVLVAALKEHVIDDLLGSDSGLPPDLLVTRCARKLHDQAGIAEDLARWSIESWALALGVVPADTLGRSALEVKIVPAPSARAAWYYSADGRTRSGPVTSADLKQLAASGRVLREHLVGKEGAAKWVRADTIKGLFLADRPGAAPVRTPVPAQPITLPVPERPAPGTNFPESPVPGTVSSKWIVWTFIPMLTWVGWLHAGIRAKHAKFFVMAALYGIPFMLAMIFTPHGAEESTAYAVVMSLNMICWIGGIVHTQMAKKEVDLRIKYASYATAGMGGDDALERKIADEYGIPLVHDPRQAPGQRR